MAQDYLADYVEVSSMVQQVSVEMAQTSEVVAKALCDGLGLAAKVRKLVALSEALPSDATFARQVRRKFVA
jgi:hypothetical protein